MENRIIVRRDDFAKVVSDLVKEGMVFTAIPKADNVNEYEIIITGY